ncbi:cupin domain-containing protein [Psychroserpens jangbogonensis]|uniref:cupin domain-containing protein n=1 Tax=Psychroserpens jangbogonensis TaxID=1484460 RepID=UPI00053D3C8E|nr:cupin domain-containing protein [Psychroserpens jangbogonensis]
MNIFKKLDQIQDYFSPKIIGEVNDVFVKIVKIKGDIVPWHNHQNEEELFYIIKGKLLFQIENEEPFIMKKGDLFIVKRGVNHRVSSKKECSIMLVENKTTKHTGSVTNAISKSILQQLK